MYSNDKTLTKYHIEITESILRDPSRSLTTYSGFVREHANEFDEYMWRQIFAFLIKLIRSSKPNNRDLLILCMGAIEIWHRSNYTYTALTQLKVIEFHRALIRKFDQPDFAEVAEGLHREIFEIWSACSLFTKTAVVFLVIGKVIFSNDF